jgi:hypothetical protein
MTGGATRRCRNPAPTAHSALVLSLSTSPATDASAKSLRRGGRSHQRGGGMESSSPPTTSAGRPDEAVLPALQWRSAHRAPRGDGPPAGPLRRGEPLIANSNPRSSRARLSAAAVTMSLLLRGEATTWTTPTCRSSPPPCWPHRRSTTAPAMDLRRRRHHAPPPFAS